MGSDKLFQNNISSENIEIRNKLLKADKEKNQHFPQKLDNKLSEDGKFDQVFHLGENEKALQEDFVCFHSTVEGKSKIKSFYETYELKTNQKSLFF